MDAAFEGREAGLGPDPASVEQILVVAPGGLTHTVRAIPALRHLRSIYPDANIVVGVRGSGLGLIRSCPHVDAGFDLDHGDLWEGQPFDLAVTFADPVTTPDPQHQLAAIAGVLADTAVAGYRTGDAPVRWQVHPVWPERITQSQRLLRLVWLLGGTDPQTDLSLWPTLADRNGAARLVARAERPLGIVHFGAGDARRRWPVERFAAVVDALVEVGIQPVLVGGVQDRMDAARIERLAHAPVINLAGNTTVGELVGVIERAVLLVGCDSAPAALASALGLQVVVIGPGSALEQTGTADRVRYVTAPPCEFCGDQACSHEGADDAPRVRSEDVLGETVLAGHRAIRAWQRTRPDAPDPDVSGHD